MRITKSSILLHSETLLIRTPAGFAVNRSRTILDFATFRVCAALAISANNASGTLIVSIFTGRSVLPFYQNGDTSFERRLRYGLAAKLLASRARWRVGRIEGSAPYPREPRMRLLSLRTTPWRRMRKESGFGA